MLTIQHMLSEKDPSCSEWKAIVDQVAAGSPLAMETLYYSLRTIRFEIAGKIGGDHVDDLYHDAIMVLMAAIQSGRIRMPEAIPAFMRKIVERKLYRFIKESARARATLDLDSVTVRDHALNPEQQLAGIQKREIAARVLLSLPARRREVLIRFYLNQESAAEIQRSMRLTETQFRLMKSRAKACFGERGRAHLAGYMTG